MKNIFLSLICLILPACAPSCSQVQRPSIAFNGHTMGTTYSVVISNPSNPKITADFLKKVVDERLEKINDIFSTYRSNSTISRFNQLQSESPMVVEPELAFVTKRALEIGATTKGAFNITLDPLITMWGFDRAGRMTKKPDEKRIKQALLLSNQNHIRVENTSISKQNTAISINLSGIAKGWAVDDIARLIQEYGFNDFLVEIGGEIVAKGKNIRKQIWNIGIEDPRFPGDKNQLVARVNLDNHALASSGNYLNFFIDSDGSHYHHIIDPRTGYPVKSDLLSVSVITKDCMSADALATAAMILGEAELEPQTIETASFMFMRLVQDRIKISFVGQFESYLSES